jgi:hypothetical protein
MHDICTPLPIKARTPEIWARQAPSGPWDTTVIPGGVSIGRGSGVIENHWTRIKTDIDSPEINANSRSIVTVSLHNVKKGDVLVTTPRGDLGDTISYYAYVSDDNEVTIVFFNFAIDKRTVNNVEWDFIAFRVLPTQVQSP